MLDQLFQDYLKEKKYVQNVSPATIRFYSQAFKFFRKYTGIERPDQLTKQTLDAFLVTLREAGKTSENVNCIVKGFNPFLSWLSENDYTPPLKLQHLDYGYVTNEHPTP